MNMKHHPSHAPHPIAKWPAAEKARAASCCSKRIAPAPARSHALQHRVHRHDHQQGSAEHACCSTKGSKPHAGHHHVDHEPSVPMPAGTIYTCPMHPEVRQVGPGNCPK